MRVTSPSVPYPRWHSAGGALVVLAACICAVGCSTWALFIGPQDVLAALPPVGVSGLGALAVYYATRSIAPGTIRRLVELEYELSP